MVLQEFPEILNDQLRRARFLILLEPLVYPDNINEFVCQIVLASLPCLECDRRAHSDRRHRQHRQDHPFGARVVRVHTKDREIFIRYVLEPVPDIAWKLFVPVLIIRGRFFVRDLQLVLAAVRAHFDLARLGKDMFNRRIDGLPLTPPSRDLLDILFLPPCIQKQPAATSARTPEQIPYLLGKPDVHTGCHQFYVPKMTRALPSPSVAGLAPQSRIDDAESGIHEPHVDRKTILIISICRDNSGDAHIPVFPRRDQAEFYP